MPIPLPRLHTSRRLVSSLSRRYERERLQTSARQYSTKKSTCGRNALASTASPNDPITLALVHGHLQLDGQYPQRAHRCGGGCCCPTREVINIFIMCFIYYLLFYANPLPSSIPPPFNLYNRQVDDCVGDKEEILIEGGQVDMLA